MPRKSRTLRIGSRKPSAKERRLPPGLHISPRQHPTLDREAAAPCRGMPARTVGSPGEAGLATGESLGSPPGAGADPALGPCSCQRMPQEPRPPRRRRCRRRDPGRPPGCAPPLPQRGFVPAALRGRPCLPPACPLPALPAPPPAGTRLPRCRSSAVPGRTPRPRAAGLLPARLRTVSRRDGLDLHPHGGTGSTQPRSPARPDPQCGQCPWAAAGRGRPGCPSAPAANAGQGRGGRGGEGRGPPAPAPSARGPREAGEPCSGGVPRRHRSPTPRPCGGCCCHPSGRARFSDGARRSAPPGVSPAFPPGARARAQSERRRAQGGCRSRGYRCGTAAGALARQGNQAARFSPSRHQDAAECEWRVGISRYKEPWRKASVLAHDVCAEGNKGMCPRFYR